MPKIGQLCETKLRHALSAAREDPPLQLAEIQSEVNLIEEKLNAQQAPSGDKSSTRAPTRRLDGLVKVMEQFFDVNDAVRRRQNADQIYRDLVQRRISRHRAIQELRKINKRQKGGWLFNSSSKEK